MLRTVLLGASLAGIAGAISGLVVGLVVYVPTAWFSMVELDFRRPCWED